MPENSKQALVIGVDVYNESLDPLPSCKNDALDVTRLLAKKLGYQICEDSPIIGSELNKDFGYTTIRKALNNFFTDTKPGKILLFYFSGHGVPWAGDVYLGTPQMDPKKPMSEAISLAELTILMGASKSNQIVSIINACYSGQAKLPESRMKKMAASNNANKASESVRRGMEEGPKGGRTLPFVVKPGIWGILRTNR